MSHLPNIGTSRPNLSPQGSFTGYNELGKLNLGNVTSPSIKYEGYNVTPRHSGYDKNRGKWYRALTTEMPARLQDLESMVRNQSSCGHNVMKELYGHAMDGSKRDHIESFVRTRNASDPNWEHALAYLNLQQYSPKQKDPKASRMKTFAMQIILECRRCCPSITNPTETQFTHISNPSNGGRSLSNLGGTDGHAGKQPPALGQIPRSQYIPQYIRQNEHRSVNQQQCSQSVGGRSQQIRPLKPSTNSNDYDSASSEDARSPSPCSTVSSDTMKSKSRRRSSSSVSACDEASKSQAHRIDGGDDYLSTSIGVERNQINKAWSLRDSSGKLYLLAPSKGLDIVNSLSHEKCASTALCNRSSASCSSKSTGTQTDQKDDDKAFRSFPQELDQSIPNTRPSELDGEQVCTGTKPSISLETLDTAHSKNDMDNASSQDAEKSCEEGNRMCFSEKPSWFENLQPVYPTSISDEDLDPLDHEDHKGAATIYEAGTLSDTITEGTRPASEEKTIRANDLANTSSTVHSQDSRSDKDNMLDCQASDVSSEARVDKPTATCNPLRSIEHNQERPSEIRSLGSSLRLDTQNKPGTHSQATFPKQNKSVRFNLDSPPSTNASTPMGSTPPSSPESASSKSSQDLPKQTKPKVSPANTATKAPRSSRPPLHRSSHSSSSYTSKLRPYEPGPPRSSSYKDLPVREPPSSRTGHQTSRHDRPYMAPAPPMSSAKRLYDCKDSRCSRRGLTGFETRNDMEAHVRAFHHNDAVTGGK
ncbi:hypothetical protein ACLMJK_001110 [Lecanora helva]